jgi:hypothetical protein
VRERDDRFSKCGHRVVKVGPDPKVHHELTHVPDGSAA